MVMTNKDRQAFRLEPLETRTLLAGDLAAITSSGNFVSNFDPDAVGSAVSIASKEGGFLVIDAAILPDAVKDLRISGFEGVTITGSDSFDRLDLSHIGSFSADNINVTVELDVHNVGALKLHSIGGVAWLFGSETRLDVGDSRAATIVSNLDSLTVSSKNDLNLISTNPNQSIRVEFRSVRPTLTFPAENVSFVDTSPTSDPATDVKNVKEDQPSYNVIVVSLSPEDLAASLQTALKRGDVETVKKELAEYLQSVRLVKSTYMATFPVGTPAEFDLSEVGQMSHGMDPADYFAGDHASMPLPSSNLEVIAVHIPVFAADESLDLPRAIGGEREYSHSPETKLSSLDMLSVNPDAENGTEDDADDRQHRGDRLLSIDSLRSTLSTLVSGVGSRFGTVSAYIIDDVGSKLEPGVLPGLLVEARSARSRRDAVDWIQV